MKGARRVGACALLLGAALGVLATPARAQAPGAGVPQAGAQAGAQMGKQAGAQAPAPAATVSLEAWRTELAEVRGLLDDDVPQAHRRATALRETVPAGATAADEVASLNVLARAEAYLGLTSASRASADRAYAQALAADDRAGQAEADLTATLNAINDADFAVLGMVTPRALRALEGVARPELVSEAMLRNAMLLRRIGRFQDSVAMAVNALEVARLSGDPLALAFAHQGMAVSFDQSGRTRESLEHYRLMRQKAAAAGSALLEAFARLGEGGNLATLGETEAGETLIRQAVEQFKRIGAPLALNVGRAVLATNLRQQGRQPEARVLYDEVIDSFERRPNRIGLWFALMGRSSVHESLGDLAAASADARQAFEIATAVGFAPYQRDSAYRLSDLAGTAGDHRRAWTWVRIARSHAEQADRQATGDRMLELAERYAAEARQRQIEQLEARNREQRLEIQAADDRQRAFRNVAVVSLVALIVAAALLLRLRRTGQALERQGSLLQSVLDRMADGVVVVDRHGRTVLDNAAARQIVGSAPVHDDLPVGQALRGEEVDHVEWPLEERGDRPRRWLMVSSRSWGLGPDGGSGAVLVFSDVTPRRLAEAENRERARALKAVVENSPDMIARFDRRLRRIYANPALARWAGLDGERLLGLRPTDAPTVVADQALAYERHLQQVLDTGEPRAFELSFRKPGGDLVSFQMRLVPERDPAGEIESVLSISRDITDLMRTQRQLGRLLDHLPDMVLRLSRDGRILFANPATLESLRLHPERIGGAALPLMRTGDGAGLFDALQQCLDTRQAQPRELRWQDGDQLRTLECRLVPEIDERGMATTALAILREVTEQKRSQALIRELAYRREAAREEERRRIARELHDELGQVLSGLRLELSALRIGPGRAQPEVAERATRLLALLDDVIRVQRGLVYNLRPQALDMGVTAALEWLVAQFASRTDVSCSLDVDDRRIELDDDRTVMIFRIVQESITNVARHAQARNLAVSLGTEGDEAVLAVEDDGRGLDPAPGAQGRGFGLVGLRERAEMLGGRLSITSAPGSGTRVEVRFPRTLNRRAAEPAREDPTPPAFSAFPEAEFRTP